MKLLKLYKHNGDMLLPMFGHVIDPLTDIHHIGNTYYYNDTTNRSNVPQTVLDLNGNVIHSEVPTKRGFSGFGYNKGGTFEPTHNKRKLGSYNFVYSPENEYPEYAVDDLIDQISLYSRSPNSKLVLASVPADKVITPDDVFKRGYEPFRDFAEEVQVTQLTPERIINPDDYKRSMPIPEDANYLIAQLQRKYPTDEAREANFAKFANDTRDILGNNRGSQLLNMFNYNEGQPWYSAKAVPTQQDYFYDRIKGVGNKDKFEYIDWYQLLNDNFNYTDDDVLSDKNMKNLICKDCYDDCLRMGLI